MRSLGSVLALLRRKAALLLAMPLLCAAPPALAQTANLPPPFMTGAVEAWAGTDLTRHSWSSYTGLTWSPLGKLAEEGVRLRLAGGYGEYRYATEISRRNRSIYGTATFADLLAGYQTNWGALTLKAFVGATFDSHVLAPFDPGNSVNGAATGAKAVVESWINLTPSAWMQLDGAIASAHHAYNSRLRLGYRVTPTLSLGLEGGGFGTAASDSGRGGGFARYEWLGGEVAMSGGVSGDVAAPRNPYATIVYLTRF